MEKKPNKKVKSHTRYHKNYKDQGHWRSRKKMDREGMVGFTYIVHCKVDDKLYLGYKQFIKSNTYQVKGKKKTRMVESNWASYTTSSKEVNERIEENGVESVEFYHIASFKNLGALLFHEYCLMARLDAIKSREFLNMWSPKMFRPTGKALAEIEEYYTRWGVL